MSAANSQLILLSEALVGEYHDRSCNGFSAVRELKEVRKRRKLHLRVMLRMSYQPEYKERAQIFRTVRGWDPSCGEKHRIPPAHLARRMK